MNNDAAIFYLQVASDIQIQMGEEVFPPTAEMVQFENVVPIAPNQNYSIPHISALLQGIVLSNSKTKFL